MNGNELWLIIVGIPAGVGITFISQWLWKKYEEQGKHHFVISKHPEGDKLQIRIQNQGQTVEGCTILCDDVACNWWDNGSPEPRHIMSGEGGNVFVPKSKEGMNPEIKVKSFNKTIWKRKLNDIVGSGI